MFTRRVFCSRNSVIFPILRTFRSNFEPINIKSEGTINVPSHKVSSAKIALARKDIDIYLQSKEVQEKMNLENMKMSDNKITPMFKLLNTNGIKVDGPIEFESNENNELETILAKMSNITIEFDDIEKTSNNNQWYAHFNISGDFSKYHEYVSHYRELKKKEVKKIEDFNDFETHTYKIIFKCTFVVAVFSIFFSFIMFQK